MSDDLQARVDAIEWYHEFEFPNGVKARSREPDTAVHRRLWQFIEAQLEEVPCRTNPLGVGRRHRRFDLDAVGIRDVKQLGSGKDIGAELRADFGDPA